MIEEAKERRRLTRAELETRNAARQVEAEKAMTDHELAQKAFYENRTRLKAERLARETERKAKGEMTAGPRPKPPKGKWYVSYESNERVGKRAHARLTEIFRNEQDAKAFARAKLAEGLNTSAGTLNPHLPKRTIASSQLLEWLNDTLRGDG